MSSKLRANTPTQNKRLELSRATESALTVPVPTGLAYMPFQRAGIEYATLTERNTLFGDPPGVGKTIQTIGFMNLKGIERVIVVCPATVLYNWKSELERWHTGRPLVEVFNPRTYNPKRPPAITLFSYYWAGSADAVKLLKRGGAVSQVVIDEVHYLKNPTKRTKYTLAENGIVSIARDHVHCLSGNAIEKKPMEIWPVLKRLWPEAVGGMTQFEFGLEFCAGHKRKIERDQKDAEGNVIKEGREAWDFNGASNLKKLGQILRSNCMVRRKRDSLGLQLPEKFPPNLVYIETDPKVKDLVAKIARLNKKIMRTGLDEAIDFKEYSEERRILGESKVKASVRYIAERFEEGHDKIVVFAHHKAVRDGLAEGLKQYGVVQINGTMSAKARHAAVEAFQKDTSRRCAILSTRAASEGITLTAAAYVIKVEWDWTQAKNDQGDDRVYRIGQKRGVMIDYLVLEGSLDEELLKRNFKEQKVLSEVYE